MKYHVLGQDTCLETSSLFSGIDVGEPASRDTPVLQQWLGPVGDVPWLG